MRACLSLPRLPLALLALLASATALADGDRIFRNGFEPQVCGNAAVEGTEACDEGGNTANCDFDCTFPTCGDNLVNGAAGETCDDGNGNEFDGCAACQIDACGNGVVSAREQCDDGNGNDLDACRNSCQLPRCGDGVASTSETCDDGGDSATCDFDCSLPTCGNGTVNRSYTPMLAPGPEQCDDANTSAGDGCSDLCQIETCGNGITEAINAEQCDDGNGNDLDACRSNCQLPRCGDGVASTSELCDAGENTASCDFDCTFPVCGDGLVNKAAGETCDDGNFVPGDGCDQCQFEACANPATASGDIGPRDNFVSKRRVTVLWQQRSP